MIPFSAVPWVIASFAKPERALVLGGRGGQVTTFALRRLDTVLLVDAIHVTLHELIMPNLLQVVLV